MLQRFHRTALVLVPKCSLLNSFWWSRWIRKLFSVFFVGGPWKLSKWAKIPKIAKQPENWGVVWHFSKGILRTQFDILYLVFFCILELTASEKLIRFYLWRDLQGIFIFIADWLFSKTAGKNTVFWLSQTVKLAVIVFIVVYSTHHIEVWQISKFYD